jgi:hypothetical protein
MQNAIQNSYNQTTSVICVISRCGRVPSTKYTLFEKTNPILKMQNEHNTLHSKKLQQRDTLSPPKNKTNQNQKLSQFLNPRKDPQKNINFPNLSHFTIHFPLLIFTFHILFTIYHTKFTCLSCLIITV